MKSLHRLVVLIAFAGINAALAQPAGFIEETVVAGFNQPVGLVFGPDELMYVWDKEGRVWIVENDVLQPAPLLDLRDEVNTFWTRGLTGLALDPDFTDNGYMYLMYTVDWEYYSTGGAPDPAQLDTIRDTFGRLVRYTLDANDDFQSIIPGSRWEMIGDAHDNGFPVTFASHTQNSIVFAPDGTMLLSAGDGASMLEVDIGGTRNNCCSTNTAEADGILPAPEQIGAFRSQLVNSHAGKILRIDPATAAGLPGNPFYDPAAPSAPRSRVWLLGLRNPYTFSIVPGSGSTDPALNDPGTLVIGDVGWDSWERLIVATTAGQNFGWPVFEGLVFAGFYPSTLVPNLDAPNPLFDGASCTQAFLNFTDLIVNETQNTPSWPNPCDPAQEIPADLTFMHTRAALAWRNSRVFSTPLTQVPIFIGGNPIAAPITSGSSPVNGPNLSGVATVGGVFYTSNKFPAEYHDSYFFADAGQGANGWIARAIFDDTHTLTDVDIFRPTGLLYPTTLVVDPDGYALYYANHQTGPSGSIRRIVVDCNGNGIGDDLDIAGDANLDLNGNGRPDSCDLPGDLNGDDRVDFTDLTVLLGRWGPCPAPCVADLADDNDLVDFNDLTFLLGQWSD